MRVVIIPFGYEELPQAQKDMVVPFAVPRHDEEGREIAWRWFEALAEAHRSILWLARHILEEQWRAPELAHLSVHGAWATHGYNFGSSPSGLLVRRAEWHARDLKYGDKRLRNGRNVSLEEVDKIIRARLERDPEDYSEAYQRRADLAALTDELTESGDEDIAAIIDLMQFGLSFPAMEDQLGLKGDTLRKRFARWRERSPDFLRRLHNLLR